MERLCDAGWNYAILSSGGSVTNEKTEGENRGGYKYATERKSVSDFTITIAYKEVKKRMFCNAEKAVGVR